MDTSLTNPADSGPVVLGGPADGAPLNAPNLEPNPNPETPPPAAAQVDATPIFMGGRKFRNAEELALYTAELERQNVVLSATRGTSEQQKILNEANQPKISDLMYEDPEAFSRLIKQQAKDELKQELQVEAQKRDYWSKFFQTYPDLSNNVDIVESKRLELYHQLKDLPPEQAAPILANAARSRLSEIRGVVDGGRVLPSGPAVVAAAGNGQTVSVQPVKTRVSDFVTELRTMQRRGGGK